MIHHAIRLIICCCVECPADSGGGSNSNGNDNAFVLAKSTVPDVILRVTNPGVRDSIVLLYCFVKINHRLPHSKEIWRRRRLGEWAARMRAMEAKGPLIKEQREALDAVPLWRPTTTQPVKTTVTVPPRTAAAQSTPQAAARASAPRTQISEKQPLLEKGTGQGAPPSYQP